MRRMIYYIVSFVCVPIMWLAFVVLTLIVPIWDAVRLWKEEKEASIGDVKDHYEDDIDTTC